MSVSPYIINILLHSIRLPTFLHPPQYSFIVAILNNAFYFLDAWIFLILLYILLISFILQIVPCILLFLLYSYAWAIFAYISPCYA